MELSCSPWRTPFDSSLLVPAIPDFIVTVPDYILDVPDYIVAVHLKSPAPGVVGGTRSDRWRDRLESFSL